MQAVLRIPDVLARDIILLYKLHETNKRFLWIRASIISRPQLDLEDDPFNNCKVCANNFQKQNAYTEGLETVFRHDLSVFL